MGRRFRPGRAPVRRHHLDGGGIVGTASPNVKANLYNPLLTDSMEHRVNHFPRVERLLVLSTPRASSDEYGLGEMIEFAVGMTEPVRVDTSAGQPKLGIQIGTSSVEASYLRTEGSSVIFGYVVLARQLDMDGIRIKTNRLSLGGATIRSVATGRNARVTYRSVDFPGHKVDSLLSSRRAEMTTRTVGSAPAQKCRRRMRQYWPSCT